MIVLIGYAVAMGCIFGAYIIHGGNIGVILHALPTELMAILGGSLGAFAVNNQPKVLKATLAAIPSVLKGSKYSKARYMELMALLYDILQKARKEGLMAIEKDVEDPAGSSLFQKYTVVGSDHHVVEFITDYLRMMVSGNLNAHEIESLMDSEIETHHAEAHGPVNALGRLAGALPAFGIVAAVLGVVNTMGSVGQPPAILGGMIGSALVGTFLGILLAYAVVEPLGGLIEQKVDEGSKELQCIKTTLLASHAGLRAAGGGRVRAQGPVLERPADVRGARRARQGQEGRLMACVAFARDVERDQVDGALRRATVLLQPGPGPAGAIPPLCRPAERPTALILMCPLHALPGRAALRGEGMGRPSPRNKEECRSGRARARLAGGHSRRRPPRALAPREPRTRRTNTSPTDMAGDARSSSRSSSSGSGRAATTSTAARGRSPTPTS